MSTPCSYIPEKKKNIECDLSWLHSKMGIVNQIANIDAKPAYKKVLSIWLHRKRDIIDATVHGESRVGATSQ
jgi:hypothetical protein